MPVTAKSVLGFIGEQSLDILTVLDPLGIGRTAAGFGSFRTPTEQLTGDIFGEQFQLAQVGEAAGMGLASFLGSLGRGVVSAFTPAVAAVAPVAGRVAATTGRVAGRALQGGGGRALLAAGAGLGVGAVGVSALGDGAPAAGNAAQAALAMGLQPISALAGGRVLAMTQGGATVTLSSTGKVIRAQVIIPAGQRLPDGATVVFISADRSQIGITKRRRRRAFVAEVRRVRRTIQGCRAVLAAASPSKRRS